MKIANNSSILFFSPHHDDESIACGGTLAKLTDNGCEVSLAVVTAGKIGIEGKEPEETMKIRESETKIAAEILGIRNVVFMGLTDQALSFDESSRDEFIRLIRRFAPDHVFLPHKYETDRDHRIVSEIGREAIWMAGDGSILSQVEPVSNIPDKWFYEVWNPMTNPKATMGIDDTWERKEEAIRAYKSQVVNRDYVSMAKGLNMFRAVQQFSTFHLAEVFK